MEQKKEQHTHSMMPKKLAEALMEAGVQHFAIGGAVGDLMGMNSFKADAPRITDQAFAPQIQAMQGRQNDVYGQQQQLAQQLLQQTQGLGPNPVQQALAQQTGQNVSQQAALMASQRGAGMNPALLARQAAMQGANIQQQGVGQAATLGAQQQLAAQQALAGQQQNMAGNALQGESIQQGAAASQNSAALGGQNINANVAAQNAQQMGGIFGKVLGGASAVLGKLPFAHGGEVPKYAIGGPVGYDMVAGPSLTGYQQFKNAFDPKQAAPAQPVATATDPSLEDQSGGLITQQAQMDEMNQSGLPLYLPPQQPMSMGMQAPGMMQPMMATGGPIPGQAEVRGDSEKNDVVPALLSPGEVVLPRSVTQSANPAQKAAEFIAHLQKKTPVKSYGQVLEAKKMARGGRC